MKPIIEIENISKLYKIGANKEPYLSLRDEVTKTARRISSSFSRLINRPRTTDQGLRTKDSRQSSTDFWALKDVCFSVHEGEAVGIIGRNGAGKSTLLKILSQITPPTKGQITMRGRVASLLEVGTGFHPEFTGRENIFLNGSVLGMSRVEIKRKFDEIVAFAEIDKFLDTPVKRYSSGMYVRLAFAVAAHLEPEILVIDEVLAVGDAQFQKKCLGKMSEVAKGGRTVLFVSHNMEAIQNLCSRSVLLAAGNLVFDGDVEVSVANYLKSIYSRKIEHRWETISNAPGNELVRLQRVAVIPHNADNSQVITVCTPLTFLFEYFNLHENAMLHLSIHVYNERGVEVFNALPAEEPNWHGKPLPYGLYRSSFLMSGNILNDGSYTVEVHVIKDLRNAIFKFPEAVSFDVADDAKMRGNLLGKWYGVVRPKLEWKTELISKDKAVVVGEDLK
ncbi:MAG: ABC transporter ATP-binding protein [Lentisphaerota bacterium]